MNIRRNKKSIVFTDVYNESQYCDIQFAADESNCKFETSSFNTKVKVSGSNLEEFIKLYNMDS